MLEDSQGWSFRRRARAWLDIASGATGHRPTHAFELGGERVLVLESGHFSGGQFVAGYVLVRGDFSCGPNCRFGRSIYVGGNCEIGKGSQLNSLVSDGRLTLSPSVVAAGSVACAGEMELRSGCRIAGKVSSRKLIRLNPHVEAGMVSAPEISTPQHMEIRQRTPSPHCAGVLEIQPPGDAARYGDTGSEYSRFQPLGVETWYYEGDLILLLPVYLRSHLVVTGAFHCPPGSLIQGDVEAGGAVKLGCRSIVRGNLLAGGDLSLEEDCVFQGNLHSRQMLRLGCGVRGLRPDGPVAVCAAGEVLLETGVSVRGNLASGACVRVHAAPTVGQSLAIPIAI